MNCVQCYSRRSSSPDSFFRSLLFRPVRRKTSFDPNVDEDAVTGADFHLPVSLDSGVLHPAVPTEPGCLTPSDSDDDLLPDISCSSSEGLRFNGVTMICGVGLQKLLTALCVQISRLCAKNCMSVRVRCRHHDREGRPRLGEVRSGSFLASSGECLCLFRGFRVLSIVLNLVVALC